MDMTDLEMTKGEKAYRILLKITIALFLVLLFWAYVVLQLFLNFFFWVVLIAIPAVILLYKQFVTLRVTMPRWLFRTVVIVLSLALLGLQLSIFPKIYVWFDWDAMMLVEGANALAQNVTPNDAIAQYLTSCWHNRFLTWVFSLVLRLKYLVAPDYSHYAALVVGGCVFVNIAMCLTAFTLERLTENKKITFFFWILCVLICGMSPWLSYPYSDAYGLVFSVLSLYLFTLPKFGRVGEWIRYACIGLSGAIGFAIKPTLALVFIAIMGLLFLRLLLREHRGRTGALFGFGCLGFFVGYGFTSLISYTLPVPVLGTKLTMFHYFYMGMNAETNGMYNYDDFIFSLQNGAKADFIGAFERIGAMGIGGLWTLLNNKLFYTFYNALFAWGTTGYVSGTAVGTPWVQFWQNVYYTGYAHNAVYTAMMDGIWKFLLVSAFFVIFWKKKKRDSAVSVLALALVGAVLMSLIFECHAKYLFVQLPLFCCLGAVGFKNFSDRVSIPRLAECMQELFVRVGGKKKNEA